MTRKVHQVIIQSKLFWLFKRYRWYCEECNENGYWKKSKLIANEQGWYHDDMALFKTLTEVDDA